MSGDQRLLRATLIRKLKLLGVNYGLLAHHASDFNAMFGGLFYEVFHLAGAV